MNVQCSLYAVIPIKETGDAKGRLASLLSATRRQELALAMFEDVLATLAHARELTGIFVVTADPAAAAIAPRHGAQVLSEGARRKVSPWPSACSREATSRS